MVTLRPARGLPGEEITVTGEGFACPNGTVDLLWDDARLRPTRADSAGRFDAPLTIPTGADARHHTVRAVCAVGVTALAATFTVLTEPPPSGSIWPWLVALVLVAAALLAARHFRHRRQERQFSRVRVAASTTTPPAAAFHETPAYGEVTYAVRVEARAATSIPTITEVHHDS